MLTAKQLTEQGYRRVSNRYGHVARIDRPDWKEFMASKGYYTTPQNKGSIADQYRRCYSRDRLTVPVEVAAYVPSSCEHHVAYVPKLGENLAGLRGLVKWVQYKEGLYARA